jgi:hypothetical protein
MAKEEPSSNIQTVGLPGISRASDARVRAGTDGTHEDDWRETRGLREKRNNTELFRLMIAAPP